jgi:hypothetical protein
VRKYLYAAPLLAAALIAAVPAASAAAAPVHVLTTGKAGGPAVKVGAVLKASLAKGSAAVFSNSLGKVTCTSSTITAKVTSNPARPGTAKESLTAQTFGTCKISIPDVFIKSESLLNRPYNVTVSDAKGHRVTISGRTKAKPVLISITVKAGSLTFTCSVKAASISGAASNKGSVVVFVKQRFTKASGGSLCPASGTFSATYGPVTDSSVKGSPHVFLN